MSWLRHDEPSLVLQEGDPLQSLDSLATLLKETEAALAQERAQHAASKAALAECKLSEREAQSLATLETSNAHKAATALAIKDKEHRALTLALENAETANREAAAKVATLDREHRAALQLAESSQRDSAAEWERQREHLQRESRTHAQGEHFWKARAQQLEQDIDRLQQAGTTSTSPGTNHCRDCDHKDTLLGQTEEKLAKLEQANAALSAQIKMGQDSIIVLTNQHSALQKTSQASVAALQDRLEESREEIQYLRQEAIEVDARHAEDHKGLQDRLIEADKHSRTLQTSIDDLTSSRDGLTAQRETLQSALEEESRRCDTLQEEIIALEAENEALRREIDLASASAIPLPSASLASPATSTDKTVEKSASGPLSAEGPSFANPTYTADVQADHEQQIAELHAQIRDLEIAFQSSNSSLLSSRSALSHTESRLGELERLLSALQPQAGSSTEGPYSEEYVLNLRAELEDEIKLRSDTEARADALEKRLGELLAERKTTAEQSAETAILAEHERHALGRSQRALDQSESARLASSSEAEELVSQLAQARAGLLRCEEQIAALQTELEAVTAVRKAREGALAVEKTNREAAEAAAIQLTEQLQETTLELESLKRDATYLREQLAAVQTHNLTSHSMTDAEANPLNNRSQRQAHKRHNSMPLCPSPLRQASYPASAPDADQDQERAILLVQRLREERDVAQERLDFYLLERKYAEESLQAELDSMIDKKTSLETELAELHERLEQSLSDRIEHDKRTASAEQGSMTHLQDRIVELSLALEDRQSSIASLIAEKDALSDSLSTSELSLRGPQNLCLSLRSELDTLQLAHESLRTSSGAEKDELQGELDYVRMYLEGAQNLVVQLENDKKAVCAEKAGLKREVGNLKAQMERFARQAEEAEAQRSDLAVSEVTLQRVVLSLVMAAEAVKESARRERELRAQVLEARSQPTVTLQMEEAALNAIADREDDGGKTALILTLVQASRRLTILEKATTGLRSALSIASADLLSTQTALQTANDVHSAYQREAEERHASFEADHFATIERMESQLAVQTEQRESLMSQHEDALRTLQNERQQVEGELRAALRAAEEEGKQLVQDFNFLSEEFEKRQLEDDSRTEQIANAQRELADALAKQEAMARKSEEDTSLLREMQSQMGELQALLEQKQLEVEETDDRYLTSLKTIKRLTLASDKLKVRIEALQRANALLVAAVPAKEAEKALTPEPVSAGGRKRALPKEFVEPDPGPVGVLAGPGMQTRALAAEGHEAISAQDTVVPHQLRTEPPRPPVNADRFVPVKGLSSSSESAKSASEAKTKEVASSAGKTTPLGTPSTAIASSRPRRPLAVVQPQAAALPQTRQAEQKPVLAAHKLGSLPSSRTAKPAFKPSTTAGVKRPMSAVQGGTDTKSLLAALQALKKPA